MPQAASSGIIFAYDEAQAFVDHAEDKQFTLSLLTCSPSLPPFWVEYVPSGERTCVRADSEEQIIKVLKEHAAGLSASDVCRKYGVSDATFYKWRSRYGGMEISDARKLKALDRRLKKLLAETMLDASTLKEMLGKNF